MSEDSAKLAMMLEHAYDASAAVRGKNKRALETDLLLCNALSQSLGMLGDAASGLSKGFRSLYRQTDWDTIAALRKFLLLRYAREHSHVLWSVVTEDLPEIIKILQPLVPEDEDEE